MKKLIETLTIAIIIIGIVYLISNMGPLSMDARLSLKYLGLGLLGILALAIIAVTIIALVTIIWGISWLKGLTGGTWGTKKSNSGETIGRFVGETVNNALKSSLGTIKEFKNSRISQISLEKYPYSELKIKSDNGDIKIVGEEGNELKGAIELLEKDEEDAEAYFENGELKIRTKSGKKASFGDLEISIPKNIESLNIESVNGDIDISAINTSEESNFKGVNGDIFIKNFKNSKEIFAKSVSGDIKIKESTFNSITGQTISGDIIFRESMAENAVFKTISGDIDYRDSSIKNVAVKSTSGDIRRP
ncbi:MAG: DUF4097 family beta strand repeat protein [Elusimicrobiales bacterium]|nr:DUF4097 family beta strand repeat protein [Elusimicrobiales bacterium]